MKTFDPSTLQSLSDPTLSPREVLAICSSCFSPADWQPDQVSAPASAEFLSQLLPFFLTLSYHCTGFAYKQHSVGPLLRINLRSQHPDHEEVFLRCFFSWATSDVTQQPRFLLQHVYSTEAEEVVCLWHDCPLELFYLLACRVTRQAPLGKSNLASCFFARPQEGRVEWQWQGTARQRSQLSALC